MDLATRRLMLLWSEQFYWRSGGGSHIELSEACIGDKEETVFPMDLPVMRRGEKEDNGYK